MIAQDQTSSKFGYSSNIHKKVLRLTLACALLLMMMTFSSVKKNEASASLGALDNIAVMKIASRFVVLIVLAFLIAQFWRHPKRSTVFRYLFPLTAFVFWAILSTLWSPLKTVSLGQASSLLALSMLTLTIALFWSDHMDTSTILCSLSFGLFLIVISLIILYFVHPAFGSLKRVPSGGVLHASNAAATASLGLIILVLSRLLWGWKWTKVLLVPGLLVHSFALLVTVSRTAIFLTVILIFIIFCLYLNRGLFSAIVFMTCLAGAVYLVIDPGLELKEATVGKVTDYVQRGQTSETVSTFNGRFALWEVLWQSFNESPVYGHGYFVCTKGGVSDVWSGPANRTAHNVILQVLVSMGLVGGLLFLWSLIRPALLLLRGRSIGQTDGKLLRFLIPIAIWYFGWGLLSSSFLGPIQPESVVFFVILGLAVGHLPYSTVDHAIPSKNSFKSLESRMVRL